MGAWGLGSFENDEALDWVAELQRSKDEAVLIAAFDAVNTAQYRESPDCTIALAAAEVVAAINGNPAPDLPDDVEEWVSSFDGSLDEQVKVKALEAVDHIVVESELQELWAETDDFPSWKSLVVELIIRLK